MTHDEMKHGAKAASMGGKALPFPITWAMRATSRLMTHGSYWI
jgi:demethoxyubiquinone hydroxylase (CLK1/Coq7/Cat5 family)